MASRIHAVGAVAFVLAAVIAAPHSVFGKGSKVRLSGRGLSSGKADLNLVQLRSCLQQQARLDDRDERMATEKARIDAEGKKLSADQDDLKARKAKVDLSSKKAVDAYNASAAAIRQRAAAFNADVDKFNEGVKVHKAGLGVFNADCGSKSYLERDYKTVMAEMDIAKATKVATPGK